MIVIVCGLCLIGNSRTHTVRETPVRLFTNVWKNLFDRGDCKFFFVIALLGGFESWIKKIVNVYIDDHVQMYKHLYLCI